MDSKLKKMYPESSKAERTLMIKVLKNHVKGGGQIGAGFLDSLKSLASKAVSGVKSVAKSAASSLADAGVAKLQDVAIDKVNKLTGQTCDKPNEVWVNSLKSGEKHQVFNVKGCKYNAFYAGPGTHLKERLHELLAKNNNNISQMLQSKNFASDVDLASLSHDIRYSLSNGDANKVREADIKFVNVLSKMNDANALVPMAAISAKIKAENYKVIGVYSGDEKLDAETKALYEKVLAHLEQKGFGKKRKQVIRPKRGGEPACGSFPINETCKNGGAKKPPSNWIKHVQQYSKKHNISYRDAMSKAKSSYKA